MEKKQAARGMLGCRMFPNRKTKYPCPTKPLGKPTAPSVRTPCGHRNRRRLRLQSFEDSTRGGITTPRVHRRGCGSRPVCGSVTTPRGHHEGCRARAQNFEDAATPTQFSGGAAGAANPHALEHMNYRNRPTSAATSIPAPSRTPPPLKTLRRALGKKHQH